jgi:hypothetical protein
MFSVTGGSIEPGAEFRVDDRIARAPKRRVRYAMSHEIYPLDDVMNNKEDPGRHWTAGTS